VHQLGLLGALLLLLSSVALSPSADASASPSGQAQPGLSAFASLGEGALAGASRHAASLRSLRHELAPSALAVLGSAVPRSGSGFPPFVGDVDLVEPLFGGAPELASGVPAAEVLDAHRGAGLLVTEPRRGPPGRGPETRIGAFGPFGETRVGGEDLRNPLLQRGCGAFTLGDAEGEREAVWVHNGNISRIAGRYGAYVKRAKAAGREAISWARYKQRFLANGASRREFQRAVDEAHAWLTQDLTRVKRYIGDEVYEGARGKANRAHVLFGQAVEARVWRTLRTRVGRWSHMGGPNAPDFIDFRSLIYDVTTLKGKVAHQSRIYGEGMLMGFHPGLPKGTVLP